MGNAMRSTPVATKSENNGSNHGLTSCDILVVLHDYPSANISEPIFRTGEKLKILAAKGSWWKVRSVQTAVEKYIPNNHAAKVYHGWLFEGLERQEAEKLLYMPGNTAGSFMIRESAQKRGVYSLSVRHRSVMHYRICRLPNNWYYISPCLTFQCLEELVEHYSDTADGLCCVLTTPCLALPTNPDNLTSQEPTVVKRRHPERTNVDRCRGSSELSFGVRHSMAFYLSLAEAENSSWGKSNRKEKSRSIYVMSNYEEED